MFDSILANLQQWFEPDFLAGIAGRLVRVILILIAAMILRRIIAGLLPKLRQWALKSMKEDADDGFNSETEKRAATLTGIAKGSLLTAVWALAIVMSLRELGFDITPILAGAGVAGLAIGFGAQNLVRDVMTGLVMLIENQVRVGDVANISGIGGAVEQINLRTTVLRDLAGTLHIIPNGQISTVSNLTREFSYYVFDTGVAYKENTDRVVAVLREISEELRQEPDFHRSILAPLEVLGVDGFQDSAVIIKTRIRTRPADQWKVGREMNRRIKLRFDQEGIEIPFPQRTLWFAAGSPSLAVRQQTPDGSPASPVAS